MNSPLALQSSYMHITQPGGEPQNPFPLNSVPKRNIILIPGYIPNTMTLFGLAVLHLGYLCEVTLVSTSVPRRVSCPSRLHLNASTSKNRFSVTCQGDPTFQVHHMILKICSIICFLCYFNFAFGVPQYEQKVMLVRARRQK